MSTKKTNNWKNIFYREIQSQDIYCYIQCILHYIREVTENEQSPKELAKNFPKQLNTINPQMQIVQYTLNSISTNNTTYTFLKSTYKHGKLSEKQESLKTNKKMSLFIFQKRNNVMFN